MIEKKNEIVSSQTINKRNEKKIKCAISNHSSDHRVIKRRGEA